MMARLLNVTAGALLLLLSVIQLFVTPCFGQLATSIVVLNTVPAGSDSWAALLTRLVIPQSFDGGKTIYYKRIVTKTEFDTEIVSQNLVGECWGMEYVTGGYNKFIFWNSDSSTYQYYVFTGTAPNYQVASLHTVTSSELFENFTSVNGYQRGALMKFQYGTYTGPAAPTESSYTVASSNDVVYIDIGGGEGGGASSPCNNGGTPILSSRTCLCASQYSGPTCNTFTTATNCANSNAEQNITNTGQQIIRNGASGGTIDPLKEAVNFTIDTPSVASRTYLRFQWGNCIDSDTVNNTAALTTFETITASNSCNDSFTFGYRVADLVSACGLSTENIDPTTGLANPNWVRYRGDHYIYYNETVTLTLNGGADNMNLTREGRLVTPIDAYIYRQYSSELNVTTSMLIYSPFQLKAAVTSTNIKATSMTSYVGVTFGISTPYEILYLTTRTLAGTYRPGMVGTPGNDVIAYAIQDQQTPLTNSMFVNQSSGVGLSPCSSYDDTGFCWKTVNFMLIIQNSSLCSLAHTFTIDQIGVTCDSSHSGADCPLSPDPNTDSSLQFTINADNFCDGSRALTIDGVITIKAYIPQRTLSRTDTTPMRSFVFNEPAYLTLFLDTDVSVKVFGITVLGANADGFQTKLSGGAYTTPEVANNYINNVNNGVNGDGFDMATQTHSMLITLDCAFVQDGTYGPGSRNCLLNPALTRSEVFAKLTFYVDYEASSGSESLARRRRQLSSSTAAANTQRGYGTSSTQVAIDGGLTAAQEEPSAAATVYGSTSSLYLTALASVMVSLMALLQ